jgi:hypothetical protein
MAFGWRGSIQAGLVEVGSRSPCTRTWREESISPPTSTNDGVSPKAILKPRRAPYRAERGGAIPSASRAFVPTLIPTFGLTANHVPARLPARPARDAAAGIHANFPAT